MGKKRKRHVLTLPKTKLHAKNQKILLRGFLGKQGGDREKERKTDRETETEPNLRVLWTLSLSRRTKKVKFTEVHINSPKLPQKKNTFYDRLLITLIIIPSDTSREDLNKIPRGFDVIFRGT